MTQNQLADRYLGRKYKLGNGGIYELNCVDEYQVTLVQCGRFADGRLRDRMKISADLFLKALFMGLIEEA